MRNITFAYFVDNKFIGWWGGTFGNISKCPKLYSNTPNQIEVIKNSFTHKLTKIENSSFDVEKEKVKGLAALSLATFDGEEKLRGKDVSLRIVEDLSHVIIPEKLKNYNLKSLLKMLNNYRASSAPQEFTRDEIKAELKLRPHLLTKNELKTFKIK